MAFPHRAAQIICPSLEYAENCFNNWKYGRISKRLSLVQLNESVFDPRMAPAGKFTGKVLVTAVPYDLAEGSWDDPAVKAELANNVIDTITEYAPNFRDAIIDKYVFTPLDFERVFGNYNWAHVDVRPDQMFGYRPMPGWSGYQTPMPGLYLAGHPPTEVRPCRASLATTSPRSSSSPWRRPWPGCGSTPSERSRPCRLHLSRLMSRPAREGLRLLERPPRLGSLIPDVTHVDVVDDTTALWRLVAKIGFVKRTIKMRTTITQMDAPKHASFLGPVTRWT